MASESPTSNVDFGEIAEQHRNLLDRIALRLSGNDAVAKDLVQETLLRALHRFGQFEPGTNARTWLVTILTNLYFDFLKHQKVMRKAEPHLVMPEVLEDELSVTDISDADLHAAILALKPDERRVVELCYLKQMRYHEAAAILGVPVSTIGTRLMRARASLRSLLTPSCLNVVNQ